MPSPTPDTWTLTFAPLADEVPIEVRVRQLLKYALRAQRLRCTRIDGDEVKARFDALPGEDLAQH
jgi:hypothetical protein